MDRIRIVGGTPLHGTLTISGAKNAALPLLAVTLLTEHKITFSNVPKLDDVHSLLELLSQHGASIAHNENTVEIQTSSLISDTAPYDIVRKMRASILVLGPLVARHGRAIVSLPGGCAIGVRPVDLHLMGLEKLGAIITLENGYINASAPRGLVGADITFPVVSVTGTENILMAATLAKGTTRIINAAREPEVIDLANCLNKMGAKITGAGTDIITIEGVEKLFGCEHRVISDRIETGTYAMASALVGGELTLKNTSIDLIPTVAATLERAGVKLTPIDDGIHVKRDELFGVDVMTEPFPGFPTDLQAQFMALMTGCQGASMITETIWENRFMHVPELARMGANITVHGASALVRGKTPLKGAPVMATDLRASVSLVMAGLAAEGETIISRVYHLDRGYESVENKLRACGANIERIGE